MPNSSSRFADLHGCKHGIAVVNGTVSLRLALAAAGIRAGSEVIVPRLHFLLDGLRRDRGKRRSRLCRH